VTDVLRASTVDVETFGHFEHDGSPDKYQVRHLSGEAQARLKATGAVDDGLWPKWKVAVTHHWRQTFPARGVVRVRHEYEAIAGFSYAYDVDDYLAQLEDGCFDDSLRKGLQAAQGKTSAPPGGAKSMISAEWVKYILTTANTWKTPITDFELVVERPKDQFVSFCWKGKVEKVSKTTFRASVRDFVPTHELLVYFFDVPAAAE